MTDLQRNSNRFGIPKKICDRKGGKEEERLFMFGKYVPYRKKKIRSMVPHP